MKPKGTIALASDFRNGSILMETILVLPLLLMLFGGLFMLGDLIVETLVVQDAGRHEAWTTHAMTRFPETTDAFKFEESDYAFKLGLIYSAGLSMPEGGGSGGNAWGWGRRGYAQASANLPFWAAFIDVQQEVMDLDGERMKSAFDFHGADSLFAPAFDYHRIGDHNAESVGYDANSYRRGVPVLDLEEQLVAGDAKFARQGGPKGEAHGSRTSYSRNPLLVSLTQ